MSSRINLESRAPFPQVDSIKSRGARAKKLRNMANLTRKEMAEEGSININSLKNWEVGLAGGLSEKGALKIIRRVSQFGILCSLEWLMHGVGPTPTIASPASLPVKEEADRHLETEIKFLESSKNNFIHKISEDTQQTPFKTGDLVAGTYADPSKIEVFLDELILLETSTRIYMGQLSLMGESFIITRHTADGSQQTAIKEKILKVGLLKRWFKSELS